MERMGSAGHGRPRSSSNVLLAATVVTAMVAAAAAGTSVTFCKPGSNIPGLTCAAGYACTGFNRYAMEQGHGACFSKTLQSPADCTVQLPGGSEYTPCSAELPLCPGNRSTYPHLPQICVQYPASASAGAAAGSPFCLPQACMQPNPDLTPANSGPWAQVWTAQCDTSATMSAGDYAAQCPAQPGVTGENVCLGVVGGLFYC